MMSTTTSDVWAEPDVRRTIHYRCAACGYQMMLQAMVPRDWCGVTAITCPRCLRQPIDAVLIDDDPDA